MRVTLFTDSDVLAGTERHILELACAASTLGCDVTVACPASGKLARQAEAAGLRVFAVEKRGLLDWRAVLRLRRALRRGEIEILHAHNGRTALIATIAISLAGAGKLVITQHFLEPSRLHRAGLGRLVSSVLHRWIARRASRLIAISNAVRDAMNARQDADSEKIVVVPNGISVPEIASTSSEQEVRRALDLCSEDLLIVCASRLEAEKDVITLIDAMARVRALNRHAICAIAGDGTERRRLEARVRELELSRHVRLLGFRTDVFALVGAADLFVLPSPVEGFGLAILEAMALGRPVVAAAAGGPLEIVVNGETGVLVRPADAGAMAAAILSLLADEPRRLRMGLAGRNRFASTYTAAQMATEITRVYRDVFVELGSPSLRGGKAVRTAGEIRNHCVSRGEAT